jgi:hypothetical protein
VKPEIPTTTDIKPVPATPAETPRRSADRASAARRMLRRLKTVLTIGLIATGLSAWAAALVQPWTARGGSPGMVIRAVSSEGERVPPRKKARLFELVRNPFLGQAQAAETVPGPAAERPASPAPAQAAPAPKAAVVLAAVKLLHLDVTLTGPNGERWAVISGHDYREGDSIGALKLVEVQEGKVKLEQGGVVCLLQMD